MEVPFTIILIAPNVSEQMGGEAIKALNILREYRKLGIEALQVTHERNKSELVDRLGLEQIYFVNDSILDKIIWRTIVFRWFLNVLFSYRAIRLAEHLAETVSSNPNQTVLFQTEPNSPVQPRSTSKRYPNCAGPINGNIYYPPSFRKYEKLGARLRRIFHKPARIIHKWFFRDYLKINPVFLAGGARTRDSVIGSGCPHSSIVDTIDYGISDSILNRPRIVHQHANGRFVHFGRLVFHKGTHMIIKAVAACPQHITLDVIGQGPELEACKQLAKDLSVHDRVRFLDWYPDHSQLLDALSQYRGFVMASLEDANGIVVQESMALGLPPICLDWGGPSLLVDHKKNGCLISALEESEIVAGIADAMQELAADGELAEELSTNARMKAQSWRWSSTLTEWLREIEKRCFA